LHDFLLGVSSAYFSLSFFQIGEASFEVPADHLVEVHKHLLFDGDEASRASMRPEPTSLNSALQGPEDRSCRERAETGAGCDDDDKAPRKTFACTTTNPIERFRDDPPGRQLDEAIKQQDHDLDGLHIHLTYPSSTGSHASKTNEETVDRQDSRIIFL
jgi:hypothetical protein